MADLGNVLSRFQKAQDSAKGRFSKKYLGTEKAIGVAMGLPRSLKAWVLKKLRGFGKR